MLATVAIAATLLASTQANPVHHRRHSRRDEQACEPIVDVAPAIWDRQCFYPKATDDFDLDSYLGRWYQVAGTVAPFTANCECIYAEYSLNDDGTVAVANGCQAQGEDGPQEITIEGTATPANSAYGDEGVFRVQLGEQPAAECPGPNYIVQEFDEKRGWAIVQASNFTTLFVLSREQNRTEKEIQKWLDVAEELGSSLDDVIINVQEGCAFT
ncbi:hypothetical protein MBLNU230_g6375t1 [Neophaeotheca triangularis]